MSAEIKIRIEQLKKEQHEVWLEESDCGHFRNDRKTELKQKLIDINTEINTLQVRYFIILDEEEEAARQAPIRRTPAKKRKQN